MNDQSSQPEQQISMEQIAEITALAANIAKFGSLIQQMFNGLKQSEERIKQLEAEIQQLKK